MTALLALLVVSGPTVSSVDIGLPADATASFANAVNAGGIVAGHSNTATGTRGFQWTQGGGFTLLPTSAASSTVNGINTAGVAVGSAHVTPFTRAVRWNPMGTLDVLPPASGNPFDVAQAVNDAGTVVGSARYLVATGPSVYEVHATRWAGAGAERIVITGATNSGALAVNASGQVAGTWIDASGGHRAFSWTEGGGVVEIPRPAGYAWAVAVGINDAGQVVGYVRNSAGTDTRAFVWTEANGMTILPLASTVTYAMAYDINNEGQIAGAIRVASGAFHAAVLVDGTWLDLEPGSPSNSLARALNDDFTVVGYVSAPSAVARQWSVSVTPPNEAPVITHVALPAAPVALGQSLAVSADFTDEGTDTHTALISWGDGTTSAGTVTGATVTGSHSYAAPGVYTVTVQVTDAGALSDSRSSTQDIPAYAVVYDASAGHATGGGWMETPSGRATFGFTAKYTHASAAPQGNTQFQIHGAGFSFKSTTYTWLVVSGGVARFQGTGEVGGQTGYDFQITAADPGTVGGKGGLRLRVVESSTGTVVYDTRPDAHEASDATTLLGGGSVKVHER